MSEVEAGVVEAFEAFFTERAEAGVVLAKAVSSISLDSDGALLIVFDPALAGLEERAFHELNPYDNLAEFPGTVIAFRNEQGALLRPFVTRIDTELPDGRSLGSLSTAEIYRRGTGEELA